MSDNTSPDDPRAAIGEFTIDMQAATPNLAGTGRFTFNKVWTGGMAGTGAGLMLSAGDPTTGNAGYVVLETFDGAIDGHRGACALQQYGTMSSGKQILNYEIVPGSGTGDLAGIEGKVELTVVDGRHEVRVRYAIPDAI